MYRSALYSALLHAAVIVLVILGLPHFASELPVMDYAVPVDVVTVAEITNAPPPEEKKPAPEKKEEPKPEPPKPKAEPAKAEPPPPPPEPEVSEPQPPEPEQPKPEPPKAVAEAAPPPTPKPKVKPEPPIKDVTPKKKPPPPDAMASILKTVEKLKKQPPPAKEKKEEKKDENPESFLDVAEKLKNRTLRDYDSSAPITISQIDAIRRHFEKCWNIPAGARDAQDLAVKIRVTMAPDATVQQATIVPDSRLVTDGFYRAAAESALRAVLNPRCRSLQDVGLSPEQYDQWRDMVITFNPKQMIGA